MSFIIMITFIIHHMVATLHAYFYHDMKPIARPLQDELAVSHGMELVRSKVMELFMEHKIKGKHKSTIVLLLYKPGSS